MKGIFIMFFCQHKKDIYKKKTNKDNVIKENNNNNDKKEPGKSMNILL